MNQPEIKCKKYYYNSNYMSDFICENHEWNPKANKFHAGFIYGIVGLNFIADVLAQGSNEINLQQQFHLMKQPALKRN